MVLHKGKIPVGIAGPILFDIYLPGRREAGNLFLIKNQCFPLSRLPGLPALLGAPSLKLWRKRPKRLRKGKQFLDPRH